MSNRGLVSVIIPAYNNAKTIVATLESVQHQSYRQLEIIVVNDGSTDETFDVVSSIQETDSRIKLVNQENCGPAEARNRGLAEATGDYVFFVDADDCVELHAVEHMVDAMVRSKAPLVIAGIRRVNIEVGGHRNVTDNLETIRAYEGTQEITKCFFRLLEENDVINSMCAKLYSREIIREYKIVSNPKLFMGEDLQFNLSYMSEIDCFYLLPEIVYEYEKYQSVLTSRYHEDLFNSRRVSVDLLRSFLDCKKLPHNMTNYLYLKLVVSQAMQDHAYHIPKKARYAHIEAAMNQRVVQEALAEFRPEGRMQKLIARATRDANTARVDRYAWLIGLGRRLMGSRVKRVSV